MLLTLTFSQPYTIPSVLAFISDPPPPGIEPVPFQPLDPESSALTIRPYDQQLLWLKISYLNHVLRTTLTAHACDSLYQAEKSRTRNHSHFLYNLRTTYFVIWSVPYQSIILKFYLESVPYQGTYVPYQRTKVWYVFLRTGTVLLH